MKSTDALALASAMPTDALGDVGRPTSSGTPFNVCAASSPIRFAEQTRPLETLQRSADVTAFPANHTPGLGGGGSMVTANTVFVFDVEGLNTAGDAHVRCTYSAQQPRRPSKHVQSSRDWISWLGGRRRQVSSLYKGNTCAVGRIGSISMG